MVLVVNPDDEPFSRTCYSDPTRGVLPMRDRAKRKSSQEAYFVPVPDTCIWMSYLFVDDDDDDDFTLPPSGLKRALASST